jgi:hypothetical protein
MFPYLTIEGSIRGHGYEDRFVRIDQLHRRNLEGVFLRRLLGHSPKDEKAAKQRKRTHDEPHVYSDFSLLSDRARLL